MTKKKLFVAIIALAVLLPVAMAADASAAVAKAASAVPAKTVSADSADTAMPTTTMFAAGVLYTPTMFKLFSPTGWAKKAALPGMRVSGADCGPCDTCGFWEGIVCRLGYTGGCYNTSCWGRTD